MGRYDPGVFGIAGRRIAEAVVALFAVLGFAFVPLGRKTALEHTLAIFSTPAALGAFRDLSGTVLRLRDRVLEAATSTAPSKSEPTPEVPKFPKRTAHER